MNNENRQSLIEDNMKLVYFIINKYYPTFIHDEDIIQYGMLGLCKAAEKWDETKSKFSTFASHAILNEIKMEFRRRSKQPETVSLSKIIHSEESKLTLEDSIMGEADIGFVDMKGLKDSLTPREKEIWDMTLCGDTQREIAERLGLSVQRVNAVIRKIKKRWERLNGN